MSINSYPFWKTSPLCGGTGFTRGATRTVCRCPLPTLFLKFQLTFQFSFLNISKSNIWILFSTIQNISKYEFCARNGMSLPTGKTEDVLTNTSEVDIWSRYLFHSNPFRPAAKTWGDWSYFKTFSFHRKSRITSDNQYSVSTEKLVVSWLNKMSVQPKSFLSSLKFWSKSWYFHPGVDAYEYILGSIKVNLPRQLCWPPHSSWKIPSTKYDTRVPGCRFTRQPIWCQNHFICWSLSSKILQSYSRQE